MENPNGCGPTWQPRIWKDKYFENECNIHDRDYSKKENRDLADRRFFTGMLSRAQGNPVRLVQAYTYYAIVRVFGWTQYGD